MVIDKTLDYIMVVYPSCYHDILSTCDTVESNSLAALYLISSLCQCSALSDLVSMSMGTNIEVSSRSTGYWGLLAIIVISAELSHP